MLPWILFRLVEYRAPASLRVMLACCLPWEALEGIPKSLANSRQHKVHRFLPDKESPPVLDGEAPCAAADSPTGADIASQAGEAPLSESLPFYFMDAHEEPAVPDTVFMFGKVYLALKPFL